MINEEFINVSSNVIFNVAFPALIFVNVALTDFNQVANFNEIIFDCIGIIITFILSYIVAMAFIKDENKKGVFVQGAFRGNYATIGLAILYNIFGSMGMAKGAIILSFSLPIFNVFAIIGLVLPLHKFNREGIKKIIIKIVTNPNIIAVIVALVFSYFKIPIDKITVGRIVIKTTEYLSGIALPLALIGIGGTLDFKNIKTNWILVSISTFFKIVIFPITATIIAYSMGFENDSLVAIFLLFGVPTAVTGYIFAKELGGDDVLAANIIVATTLGSIITLSAGVLFFKVAGLINV
jgi:hypothetical protein